MLLFTTSNICTLATSNLTSKQEYHCTKPSSDQSWTTPQLQQSTSMKNSFKKCSQSNTNAWDLSPKHLHQEAEKFLISLQIDLHFKLRGSEALARIMSKNSPINKSYETWKSTNLSKANFKIITTFRKLELASQQILMRNINHHSVQKVSLWWQIPTFHQFIWYSTNRKHQRETEREGNCINDGE